MYTQSYKLPPTPPHAESIPPNLASAGHMCGTRSFYMTVLYAHNHLDRPPAAISIPRVIDSCNLRLVLWERVTYSAASTSNTKEENINYIHHFGVAERAVTANTVRSNSAPDKFPPRQGCWLIVTSSTL